jgi:hypothetical protein
MPLCQSFWQNMEAFFSEKATSIDLIPFADAPQGTMQGQRYASLQRLKSAKKLTYLI